MKSKFITFTYIWQAVLVVGFGIEVAAAVHRFSTGSWQGWLYVFFALSFIAYFVIAKIMRADERRRIADRERIDAIIGQWSK